MLGIVADVCSVVKLLQRGLTLRETLLHGITIDHCDELLPRDLAFRRKVYIIHSVHNTAVFRPGNGIGIPGALWDVDKAARSRNGGAAFHAIKNGRNHCAGQVSIRIKLIGRYAIHVSIFLHLHDIGIVPCSLRHISETGRRFGSGS